MARAPSRKTGTAKGRKPANRGAQAKKRSDSGLPAWLWMVTGAALFGFAVLIVQLHLARDEGETEAPVVEEQPEPDAEEAPADEEAAMRYEFHELLREDEVHVPDDAPEPRRRSAEAEEEALEPAPTVEPDESYLLQAGSFRNHDDADGMRASLTLLGLRAEIHTVELDDGEEWHRVRVGPFDDPDAIERARSRLIDADIQPLLLRQRG